MARGWDSKAIESQQADAELQRVHKPAAPLSEKQRAQAVRRRTLELARTKAAADLSKAAIEPHRQMLKQTIEAIDEELTRLKDA